MSWHLFLRREIFVAGGLLAGVIVLMWFSKIEITARDALVWLGSITSTFIGAWFAFQFNALKSERERVDKEVVSGNLALSTLVEFWDRQKQYQAEIIDPHRDGADAWFNLPAGMRLDTLDLSLGRTELAFLLLKSARTWQKIVLEERRFHLLASLIDERNDIILKDAWPKLSAAGMQIGGEMPLEQFEQLLGPSIVQRLRVTTKAIIDNTDANVGSCLTAFETLRDVLQKNYPRKKFIKLDQTKPLEQP